MLIIDGERSLQRRLRSKELRKLPKYPDHVWEQTPGLSVNMRAQRRSFSVAPELRDEEQYGRKMAGTRRGLRVSCDAVLERIGVWLIAARAYR